MSHSLINADRRTHSKIVAVALGCATLVILVGITARTSEIDALAGRATAQGPVLKAGKVKAATITAPVIR